MSFPHQIAQAALLDSGRHCCICHRFCGTKIELHHITPSEADGDDSYDNCIPLCFDCHAEVKAYNPKHPKGRQYTESELREHRDRWYTKVRNSEGIAASANYIDVDRKLYEEIREILPSDRGSIVFLRFHEYASSFHEDAHADIEKFAQNCSRPEFEFLDADLEGLRGKLARSIDQFLRAVSLLVYPVEGRDYRYAVPQEWRYLSEESKREWQESVDKLNDLSAKVCQAYDELVRLCRRKLAC